MKAVLSLSLIVPLFFCVSAQAKSIDVKTPYPKEVLTLTVEDTPDLSVKFSHDVHTATIGCDTCHHLPRCAICHYKPTEKQSPWASCSSPGCHPDVGRSQDPHSRFMAFHTRESDRSCFGCHTARAEEQGVSQGCLPCHDDGRSEK
jgi:hypothetical protein